jgi:hypothetical protein
MTIDAVGDRSIPVTGRQVLWAICSMAGLAIVGWATIHAPAPSVFFADLGQSWSAMVVALDLSFLGFASVTFAVVESLRLKMRLPWIWIPLGCLVPAGAMFPFFLLLRERVLLRAAGKASGNSTA